MNFGLAIILAAGRGTRMKSDLPKVLIELGGRPMIEYVLDAVGQTGIERSVVVVGYRAEMVRDALSGRPEVSFAHQDQQLGTGHAVRVCQQFLAEHDGPVLVLTGDSPLTQSTSLTALLELYEQHRPACVLGSTHHPTPTGLGRIVRDATGEFMGIVEEKDATAAQLAITEVNMSTYVFDGNELKHALEKLNNNNRQSEYYLTDVPGILKAEGKNVQALDVLEVCESLSINTVEELKLVEAELVRRRDAAGPGL